MSLPLLTAHQLRRVVRARKGDRILVFCGDGNEHVVELHTITARSVLGRRIETRPCGREASVRITLLQALLPRERFELAIQKGTEVGVTSFVPLVTERCRERAERLDDERLGRWQRVAVEAAEQSGRGVVPRIEPPRDLASALAQSGDGGVLLAWEHERDHALRDVLREMEREERPATLALIVGPEGGFTEREVEIAHASGARTVSLGPRVLRAETAGPLFAALVLYELDGLEPR
ncbi:MAG: 16S rRNA (uracil(1498)-N(3))-methyltransferase [Chloroflexi bacterium]|nr:16S rRNA (uracil(1498)-N(3))-methyltransferase [Chloroflexota bacterium]